MGAPHRWVVRKRLQTMAAEDVAHLVPAPGVVRAQPSVCGERISNLDFWERAAKDTVVCKTCRAAMRRRQPSKTG